MIHLKSTLAISAFMLAGLVAASPFPYSSDHEPRPVRRTASLQATAVAEASALPPAMAVWADPPVRKPAPAEAPAPAHLAEAPTPALEATPAPVTVPVPVRHASLQSSVQVKAEQVRRRKLVRVTRERQMAARQPAPATDAQVASGQVTSTPQRIDPIGDILRGLGIGREG